MNRKQIVNENLQWPEISQSQSQKIISYLEKNFEKYPLIRRKKNPPRHIRKKAKLAKTQKTEESKPNLPTNDPTSNKESQNEFPKPNLEGYLKNHFKIGINSVTKTIEQEPNNVMFVLVCHSCKPLTVLTRHLQVMCAMANIPAGCVHNLSPSLKKLLNINTISAFLVLKTINLKLNEAESSQQQKDITNEIEVVLKDLQANIPSLLPKLKNPFTENQMLAENSTRHLMGQIENELNSEIEKAVNEQYSNMKNLIIVQSSESSEEDDNFESGFLSINKRKSVKYLDFDDTSNFILFNDTYQNHKKKKAEKMEF